MIHFVENIDRGSDVAYFALEAGSSMDEQDREADIEALKQAMELLRDQGPFPDVELILQVIEEGVVRKSHQHLLRSHIDSLDPPVSSFSSALFRAEDEGLITEERSEVIYETLGVGWRDSDVLDATGRSCDIDGVGQARLYVDTEFDTVEDESNPEVRIAREHGLGAFVYQLHLRWEAGRPVLLPSSSSPASHTTLGTIGPDGRFNPVMSVPQPAPARD